ncbi:MAG: hypothetical protein JNK92_06825 [Dechloromonas sp.]|nr:hypothetical protein [Dechloromonas sp.]
MRDFSLLPSQMALASATITQAFWLRFFGLRDVGFLSPLITGLELGLLLGADNLWEHPLAALLGISAKFLLRIRGKHVFNPANFGVGFTLIVLPGAWVSPGQWGNDIGLAPLVPLWDFLWPGNRYNWHGNKPLQKIPAKSGKIVR